MVFKIGLALQYPFGFFANLLQKQLFFAFSQNLIMKEITRHFCAKIAAPLSLLISAVQKFRKEARQESWESIRCSFDVCLDAALVVPEQE